MVPSTDRRFGCAWLCFSVALAVHVVDEAAHNFLSFYNPNARLIRDRYHLPVPVFTFEGWIASLGIFILLLLFLTPLAFRGARALRIAAVPLAVLVGVFNALLHIGSSLYFRRWMPGVYSSPLLLAAAGFVLLTALSRNQQAVSAAA